MNQIVTKVRSRRTKTYATGTSLVAQQLRIHLPVRGTPARSLIQEDPTCPRAAKPTVTEACASRAGALQQKKPPQ